MLPKWETAPPAVHHLALLLHAALQAPDRSESARLSEPFGL